MTAFSSGDTGLGLPSGRSTTKTRPGHSFAVYSARFPSGEKRASQAHCLALESRRTSVPSFLTKETCDSVFSSLRLSNLTLKNRFPSFDQSCNQWPSGKWSSDFSLVFKSTIQCRVAQCPVAVSPTIGSTTNRRSLQANFLPSGDHKQKSASPSKGSPSGISCPARRATLEMSEVSENISVT